MSAKVGVIHEIELECTKGSSNKFYNYRFNVDIDNCIYITSWFGPIGSSGQVGASGKIKFDVCDSILNNTLERDCEKLASEANKLIQGKIKKNYEVVAGEYPVKATALVTKLKQHFAETVVKAGQQPAAISNDEITVEVVGISGGAIQVAEILDGFNYNMLGIASNPNRRNVRVGDDVRVTRSGGVIAIV
jgi:hypothetical protein